MPCRVWLGQPCVSNETFSPPNKQWSHLHLQYSGQAMRMGWGVWLAFELSFQMFLSRLQRGRDLAGVQVLKSALLTCVGLPSGFIFCTYLFYRSIKAYSPRHLQQRIFNFRRKGMMKTHLQKSYRGFCQAASLCAIAWQQNFIWMAKLLQDLLPILQSRCACFYYMTFFAHLWPVAPFLPANCGFMDHGLWWIRLPRSVQLYCWCFRGYSWACCKEACPRITQVVVYVSYFLCTTWRSIWFIVTMKENLSNCFLPSSVKHLSISKGIQTTACSPQRGGRCLSCACWLSCTWVYIPCSP